MRILVKFALAWGSVCLSVLHRKHTLCIKSVNLIHVQGKRRRCFSLSPQPSRFPCLFLGRGRKACTSCCLGCYFHPGVCWQLQSWSYNSCSFSNTHKPIAYSGLQGIFMAIFSPHSSVANPLSACFRGSSVVYPQVWSGGKLWSIGFLEPRKSWLWWQGPSMA